VEIENQFIGSGVFLTSLRLLVSIEITNKQAALKLKKPNAATANRV